jgi:hypothetical protein
LSRCLLDVKKEWVKGYDRRMMEDDEGFDADRRLEGCDEIE